MRFHHSTRRGRNRLGQYSQHQAGRAARHHPTSVSRWSQLGYCRETNIHFNRRMPIEPPANSSEEEPDLEDSNSDELEQQVFRGASKETIGGGQGSRLRPRAPTQDSRTGKLRLQHSSFEYTRMPADCSPAASPDSGTSGLHMDQPAAAATATAQRALDLDLDRLSLADKTQADGLKHSQEEQQQLFDMESARQRLVAQVEKHPFWSNKAARRMRLSSPAERNIYIYKLVSFCERRDLEWRFEPYRGGLAGAAQGHFRFGALLHEGAGARASASQPGTPLDSPLRRAIRVPVPAQSRLSSTHSRSPPSADAPLTWSSDHHHHQSTGPPNRSGAEIRRSRSQASSPTRTTLASGTAAAHSLERKLPPADFVWSIEAPAHLRPEPFVGQLHTLELPGSSFVKRCHGCQGRGRLKCASCYGVGYEVCISCSGRGTTRSQATGALGGGSRANDRCDGAYARNSTSASGYDDSTDGFSSGRDSGGKGRGNEPGGITNGSSGGSGGGGGGGGWSSESCHFCHGAGQKRCWVCAGKSYNHCQGCQGLGQLRCYLQLNITWTNHRDEIILNNADNIIPKERLHLCSGQLLSERTAAQLEALPRHPAPDGATTAADANQLHLASRRLLDRHRQAYRHERLIRQRHRVTQIQCHVVNYEWKHRSGHFVIYGNERKVYIAKYPFKSICNIT